MEAVEKESRDDEGESSDGEKGQHSTEAEGCVGGWSGAVASGPFQVS